MTYRVPKSAALRHGDQFGVLVAAHGAELRKWREHMERVEQDRDRDVPIEERHAPYPAPRSAPEIEGALDENGDPDFEVYDDGPSDGQRMIDLKADKLAEVGFYAEQMIDSVFPIGKRGIFDVRMRDLAARDAALLERKLKELRIAGIVDKITGRASALARAMMDPDFVRTLRTPEDNALADEQARVRAEVEGVHRWLAEQHEAIEDAATIDELAAWSPSPLA